ncbi:MAG: hypothetical protein HYY06_30970 [Deltaproteobacteria bacterium]|nr:hypothetical protein [Deltaproteobacteria bacterium]
MSGFLLHDYVLTFEIADPARGEGLRDLCKSELEGDEITSTTWEISTRLSPHELERKLESFLAEGDRAAYYYLTDTKRLFRVDLI